MFRNYLKLALRTFNNYKGHTSINVFGLSVGIAATLLIIVYIRFEFSYDNFHLNADRIFRISVKNERQGVIEGDSPQFTPPIGPAMVRDLPEVISAARFSTYRSSHLYIEKKPHQLNHIRHADPTIFDLFSFKLITGNPQNALTDPYSIVLTQSTAERLFGIEQPLGKTVNLDRKNDYLITGIIEDPPDNSHLQFNALISFSTLYDDPDMYLDWNGGNQYYTYVLLEERASVHDLEKKFPEFMWRYINKDLAEIGINYQPYLQPLKKIHLHFERNSGMANIYLFSVIAGLILLIACINFINLTIARSLRRNKEVGIRKVLGANREALIGQFLTESILLTFLSTFGAFILIELFSSIYSSLTNIHFSITDLFAGAKILYVIGTVVIVGMIAGGYPAIYLSSFQPTESLKGAQEGGRGRTRVRNPLVIVHFTISIALIISTIVIGKQLTYMANKDLGFDNNNLLVIPLSHDDVQTKVPLLIAEIGKIPGVSNVCASSEAPIRGFTSNGYFPEGYQSPLMIHVVDIDEHFLETYDINLVTGRNFKTEMGTDQSAFLINQALAGLLGWEDPVGRKIERSGEHEVIGVVKDFHYSTLYDPIEPLILTNRPWRDRYSLLTVRLDKADINSTLNAIKMTWEQINADIPFEFSFLDESFQNLYLHEQRLQRLIQSFTVIALIIALLGLHSLAAFAAMQSTKEIGIRKVLGATVTGIVTLLSRDFMILVGISAVIACPLAYYAMNKWLQSFAYRIEVNLWIFVTAGLVALLIAMVTVSFQALKAALTDPVKSLKYE